MVEHDFIEGNAGEEPDDTLSAAVAALAERAEALPDDTDAGDDMASNDAPDTTEASADVVAVAEPEPEALTATATATATAETGDTAEAADAGDLLDELSRAMRAAAGSRHLRIAEELAQQRAAQVEAIKTRATSESDEIKKGSKRDIADVDAWMKTASDLIAAERVRRIEARKEKLRAELLRQDVIVEREVLSVEAAVTAHQSKLDAFFEQLEHESDPAEIARLAASMPSLPSLSEAADEARRRAAAEYARLEEPLPEGVAAMTPEAAAYGSPEAELEVSSSRLMAAMGGSSANGTDTARAWEPTPEADAVPVAVDVATPETTEPNQTGWTTGGQAPDNVDVTASDTSDAPASDETPTLTDYSGSLLRAIPSSRPIDRLRPPWNRKPDDEPTQES